MALPTAAPERQLQPGRRMGVQIGARGNGLAVHTFYPRWHRPAPAGPRGAGIPLTPFET